MDRFSKDHSLKLMRRDVFTKVEATRSWSMHQACRTTSSRTRVALGNTGRFTRLSTGSMS